MPDRNFKAWIFGEIDEVSESQNITSWDSQWWILICYIYWNILKVMRSEIWNQSSKFLWQMISMLRIQFSLTAINCQQFFLMVFYNMEKSCVYKLFENYCFRESSSHCKSSQQKMFIFVKENCVKCNWSHSWCLP